MLFSNANQMDDYGGHYIKKRPVSISNGLLVTEAHRFDFRQAERINLTMGEDKEIRQKLLQGKTKIAGSVNILPVMAKEQKSDTFGEDATAKRRMIKIILIVLAVLILVVIAVAGGYMITNAAMTKSQIAFSFTLLANLFLAIVTWVVPVLVIGLVIYKLYNHQGYIKEYAEASPVGTLEVYDIPVTDKYYYADADTVCDYLEIGGVAVEVNWTVYNKVAIGQKQRCAFLRRGNKQYFAVIV